MDVLRERLNLSLIFLERTLPNENCDDTGPNLISTRVHIGFRNGEKAARFTLIETLFKVEARVKILSVTCSVVALSFQSYHDASQSILRFIAPLEDLFPRSRSQWETEFMLKIFTQNNLFMLINWARTSAWGERKKNHINKYSLKLFLLALMSLSVYIVIES